MHALRKDTEVLNHQRLTYENALRKLKNAPGFVPRNPPEKEQRAEEEAAAASAGGDAFIGLRSRGFGLASVVNVMKQARLSEMVVGTHNMLLCVIIY